MVESVEELGTELQLSRLAELELPGHREIQIVQPRCIERISSQRAPGKSRRRDEGRWIEPLVDILLCRDRVDARNRIRPAPRAGIGWRAGDRHSVRQTALQYRQPADLPTPDDLAQRAAARMLMTCSERKLICR